MRSYPNLGLRGDIANLPLTGREIRVLRMSCDGANRKQIAAALGLSVITVRWYRARLYAKAGINTGPSGNLVLLLRWAIEHGIVIIPVNKKGRMKLCA